LSENPESVRTVVDTNVFLSYSSADYEVAKEVRQVLESSGLRVFDDKDIRVGQTWVGELDTAVRSAQVFIPLISSNYSTSPWTTREWAVAFAGRNRVVPVLIEHEARIPGLLAPYVGIDASDVRTRRSKLEQLAHQVAESSRPDGSIEDEVDKTARLLGEARAGWSEVSSTWEFLSYVISTEDVARRFAVIFGSLLVSAIIVVVTAVVLASTFVFQPGLASTVTVSVLGGVVASIVFKRATRSAVSDRKRRADWTRP
jgi:hypothetical protein